MPFARRLVLGLSLALTAAMLGVAVPPGAKASCVGPTITVDGPSAGTPALRRGQTVTVLGMRFHSGCEDTSASGPACHAQPVPTPPDPESPFTAVALTLHQGKKTWLLGTQDAASRARQYAISWQVSIPADTKPGPAELRAGATTLDITIVR